VEFDVYVENICSNLELAISIFEEKEKKQINSKMTIEEAENVYDKAFEKLSDKRDDEIAQGHELSEKTGAQLKEALLVSEQLKWLHNLSKKLVHSSKKYKSS